MGMSVAENGLEEKEEFVEFISNIGYPLNKLDRIF